MKNPVYVALLVLCFSVVGCAQTAGLREAAEQRDAAAEVNFGLMYANGCGVVRDDAQAVTLFRKGAAQYNPGVADAGGLTANSLSTRLRYLGAVYASSLNPYPSSLTSPEILGAVYADSLCQSIQAARAAHAWGLGRIEVISDAQLVSWNRKAAERRDANAQYSLGAAYESGRGVARDDAQAAFWYRKAAEQGDATAEKALGKMYAEGRGVARDNTQAAFWARKAAEWWYVNAQDSLHMMYASVPPGAVRDYALAVSRDYALAVSWYRKAAEQGNAAAQNTLGGMYADGRGVAEDDAQPHSGIARPLNKDLPALNITSA